MARKKSRAELFAKQTTEEMLAAREYEGLIDHSVDPIGWNELMGKVRRSSRVVSHILSNYRLHTGKPENWAPSQTEINDILESLLIYRNARPEGGYVFRMFMEGPDGEDRVVQFRIPGSHFVSLN
jgi:hypothetical protein